MPSVAWAAAAAALGLALCALADWLTPRRWLSQIYPGDPFQISLPAVQAVLAKSAKENEEHDESVIELSGLADSTSSPTSQRPRQQSGRINRSRSRTASKAGVAVSTHRPRPIVAADDFAARSVCAVIDRVWSE